MSQSLVILGRQPALGLAELESLVGADPIHPLATVGTALVDTKIEDILFKRLGGTIKVAKLLHEFDSPQWKLIERYLIENLPKHLVHTAEGKLTIGLSVFGLDIAPKQLLATGLSIKKVLKAHGKSVRLVPNKEPALNSAQVIHNKLIGTNGWELIFVRDGQRILMGLTVHEQDIEAYAARDQARPKRDARVGMLPPKLAQIIFNLAVSDTNPLYGSRVLDPFCGTGVILQEASLMGFEIVGSDLDPQMVDYTDQNLMWLFEQPDSPVWRPKSEDGKSEWRYFKCEVGDATSYTWDPMPNFIATETYLGRPFSSQPDTETLNKVIQDVDTIHKKFLQNVSRQTKPGFRMCIAVPAWHTRSGVKHLKTLDSLEELGYTRMSFVHARDKDLIYHREGQIVGRQLVTLIRK